MPIARPRIRYDSALAARSPHDPIVAGFYVNWDDNSLVSLRQRIDSLDWVVAEWVLLGRGADTIPLTFQVDRRVLALAARGLRHPQVFALITNFIGEDFDPRAVARLVDRPRIRKKAIADLVAMLEQYNLAGITIDFEEIPPAMHPRILTFLRELKAALVPSGRLLTQALPMT
jgi:spore germination protein YaaH